MAIYKRSREVELRATELNISERDLNPRPTDFKSGALTTRPRCLLQETCSVYNSWLVPVRLSPSRARALRAIHFGDMCLSLLDMSAFEAVNFRICSRTSAPKLKTT